MMQSSRSQACIFVIDDESTNLKLIEKILLKESFTQIVAIQDPREVILRYQQTRPDLILLDINMPNLDGYEVMQQLKSLDDPVPPPIIVLTAAGNQRDILLRALAAGARDFLAKPFDRIELLMRVQNLLDAHLAHRMTYDQKSVLEELVRARTEDLNRTRLQIVHRLGRAAEYRDNETGLHIVRMSETSALLARSLGWSEAQCELLLHASPMHDIGKIGIPDAILQKPGKLEADEWEIMKTHATIGAKILDDENSDLLQLARTIALSHHEKWDGSGYPHGLVGEAIPIAARIVAVADVFDALTSSRPYKAAWPQEKAIDFILDQAGRHFDPAVVTHFSAQLGHILSIQQRYQEPLAS